MPKGLVSLLIVWLAGFLACGEVHAQDRDRTIRQHQHTAWTAKDGAPVEIWGMDQGPDGFLWLGTGSGLYRFDGVSFERYQPAAGQRLASIDITAVKVLSADDIWIGYSDGGVSRLQNGRVTTFLEKDGIWPGMVVGFQSNRDGALWAVSHGGLTRFEADRWRKIGEDWNVPSEMIVGLFPASDGTLWLSTAGSIYFCRPGARRFEPTGAVTQHATFTQTPDGRMWISDGLHGLRPLPNYPAKESQSPWLLKDATPADTLSAANYAIDRQGVIWGTDRLNGGIFRFDPRNENPPGRSLLASDVDVFRRADGLTSDRSIPILTDREGNIWVGTNAGLNRFRSAEIIHDTAVPGTTAFGYSIAATPDATYITDGIWLYRARPNEAARRLERLPAAASTLLLRAKDGALVYGNQGYVYRVQGDKLSRFPPPAGVLDENIKAIAEDGAGTLWLAFERSGVYWLKEGVWTGKADFGGLPTPSIAVSDPAGAVWFGFSDGRVSRHDQNGMQIFSSRDDLNVGGVEAITFRDNTVWVGGEFGIARLDQDRFHTIGPDRMAPFFGISGIGNTADGDYLFNGLMGVVRMKADDVTNMFTDASYSPAYDLYDESDGLPGVAQQGWRSPTVVTGADGRIWFISNTGVAFLANRSERNLLPPPVTILSAASRDHAYSTSKPLMLPAGASSLTIVFTAASLSAPEKVRFRYKLEGLNTDWIDAGGHREAVYNNLGPGNYRFRVIAANEDGVWNADGAVLAIEIPPTFLQSWPFKLLCAFILIALLWLAYLMRLRVVAERVHMRLAERMGERERIARELHDTLLQSVQTLTLRFQFVVDELPQTAPARPALEDAINRADEVIAEGRDRVRDLRSLQYGDIEAIIEDLVKRQTFDPEVEIAIISTGVPRPLDPLSLDEIARIASEGISNVWRHARTTRVTIEIGHGANFRLRITDNGVGIDPEMVKRSEKEGHFGLAGMRERAKKLRGDINIRRLPEGGSEVLLTAPGSIAYKSRLRRVLASFGRTM